MVVVPWPVLVALPVEAIVATVVNEDDQLATDVKSAVVELV